MFSRHAYSLDSSCDPLTPSVQQRMLTHSPLGVSKCSAADAYSLDSWCLEVFSSGCLLTRLVLWYSHSTLDVSSRYLLTRLWYSHEKINEYVKHLNKKIIKEIYISRMLAAFQRLVTLQGLSALAQHFHLLVNRILFETWILFTCSSVMILEYSPSVLNPLQL